MFEFAAFAVLDHAQPHEMIVDVKADIGDEHGGARRAFVGRGDPRRIEYLSIFIP